MFSDDFDTRKVDIQTEPLSWDECFMQMAYVIARRSKDPNSRNGAVIVDQENIVVGMGYNGWPKGIEDCELPWSKDGTFLDTKYAYVCHAEENAVYNSNNSTKGCKMYCTLSPCNECAKTIIQNGIVEVIYASDTHMGKDICKAAFKMFDLARIRTRRA